MIRFEDPNGDFAGDPLYEFSNPALYTNSVLNQDPVFFNTGFNDFNIETGTSGADGIGLPGVGPSEDINGVPRGNTQNNPPDAGAYESIVFPKPPPGGTP